MPTYDIKADKDTDSAHLWGQPITNRRRKVRVEGVDENMHPRTDRAVMREFARYVTDKNTFKHKFENGTEPNSHRFSDAYARTKFGETLGADMEMNKDWDDLHCALITRRGSWWTDDGEGQPIIDFLDDLRESNRNITQWYRRNLDTFARVTTVEHHENGYPHIHDHLWHCGELTEDKLEGAVGAHVRNSPVATADQHPTDGAIRVWKADPSYPDGDTSKAQRTSLVGHATKHLCWGGARNAEPAKSRVLAALWAANVNSFNTDRTFSEYVKQSQDPDMAEDNGEYVGIEMDDGTVIEKEQMDGSGGTEYVVAEPNDDMTE